MHGSDKPLTPYLPRRSRGCIVLSNRDLLELARYVSPGVTPLLIVKRLQWQTTVSRLGERREFEDFLARWRHAGEKGFLEGYVGMYSARYRKYAMGSEWWNGHRDGVYLRQDPGWLRTNLQSIVCCGEYAVLAVDHGKQDSSRKADIKRMFLIREDGLWRILALDWLRPSRPADLPGHVSSSARAALSPYRFGIQLQEGGSGQ